jgi:hypothetical protein
MSRSEQVGYVCKGVLGQDSHGIAWDGKEFLAVDLDGLNGFFGKNLFPFLRPVLENVGLKEGFVCELGVF